MPTEFTYLYSLPASGRVSHGLASFPVTGDGAPRPEETLWCFWSDVAEEREK